MHKLLMATAFIGIVLGKVFSAFAQGVHVGLGGKRDGHHETLFTLVTQQNAALLNHMMLMQTKLMDSMVVSDGEEGTRPVSEIMCRKEHLDLVQQLMDEDSESVVKETASWASQNMASYDLSLTAVSLETERSFEPDREHDVVLVFHVTGKGSDALRFQADISRRLREASDKANIPSVRMLRADVRWA